MHIVCPKCADPESARVLQTVRRASGARWRRHQCSTCGHRWSTTEPDAFTPTPRRIPRRSTYELRRLSDREAAMVLLSREPLSVLTARYGVTKASIQAIKRGDSYKNVHALLYPLLQEVC